MGFGFDGKLSSLFSIYIIIIASNTQEDITTNVSSSSDKVAVYSPLSRSFRHNYSPEFKSET